MTYDVFSIVSQQPSIPIVMNSRQDSGTRGKSSPRIKNSVIPCSTCVNEYASMTCCELCCDITVHDHGDQSPAGHHHSRPCDHSIKAAANSTNAHRYNGVLANTAPSYTAFGRFASSSGE